jgi:hypothetical protein
MNSRERACPRCGHRIVFNGPLLEAEYEPPAPQPPKQVFLKCPSCSRFLVMRSGRLGQGGAAILAYTRYDFVRILANGVAILSIVLVIVVVVLGANAQSRALHWALVGFVGGVFINCLFNTARGLHTGMISGLSQSMMPARDRIRSLEPQEYWTLVGIWGLLAAMCGYGVCALIMGW